MSEGQALVGATIAGKYRIKRLIGVGGMGSVYEGQHVDLAKRVAVKIIDSAAVMSPELATRFKREARAASAVESEGIVQVFDVGRDPQVGLYMVMEFLQGEDLEMRLRRQVGRRLDPLIAADIGHQVARALAKAHGARVIHRDLKPANIFLTDRDDGSTRVKVLDFGISKLLASEQSMATSKEGCSISRRRASRSARRSTCRPSKRRGSRRSTTERTCGGSAWCSTKRSSVCPRTPSSNRTEETIMKS